jgi:hypothetical protein
MAFIAHLYSFQTWCGAPNDPTQTAGHIFSGEVGHQIKSVQIASGTMTIRTKRPHGLTAPCVVVVQGVSTGDQGINIDGAYIAATASGSTITITTLMANAGPYHPDFALILPTSRPIIVVSESQDNPLRGNSIGTGGASVLSGALDILIEADVDSDWVNLPTEAMRFARNLVGDFQRDLIQNQGTADYIVLNTCEIVSLEFTDHAEQDDGRMRYERFRALLRCTWGLEG